MCFLKQDLEGIEHNYQVEDWKQKYLQEYKVLKVQLSCETVFG